MAALSPPTSPAGMKAFVLAYLQPMTPARVPHTPVPRYAFDGSLEMRFAANPIAPPET